MKNELKSKKNILKYKNTRKNIHKVPNYGSKRSKSSEKMPIEMEFFPEMWFGWRKRMCWLAVNSMRSTINHIHLWLDFSERHFIVNVNSIKWKPKSTVLPLNISRFRVRTHSFCSFCNYFCAHCNHDLSILCVRVRLSNFHHPRNSSIKTRERKKVFWNRFVWRNLFFSWYAFGIKVFVHTDWNESGLMYTINDAYTRPFAYAHIRKASKQPFVRNIKPDNVIIGNNNNKNEVAQKLHFINMFPIVKRV